MAARISVRSGEKVGATMRLFLPTGAVPDCLTVHASSLERHLSHRLFGLQRRWLCFFFEAFETEEQQIEKGL
jgi:hypothetical protein